MLAPPPAPATFGGKPGRIAFVSTPTLTDEGKYEIYTMKADGSDTERLTNNTAFDSGPTFSPDGKRIAFVSHRDGNYEIYVMNADGTDQQRLTHSHAQDREPAFSPDGKRIAFASDRAGNLEIYVMNVDGTEQHRLTHRDNVDDDPTFFPNGNKLAFVRVGAGLHDIFTMRADGSRFHRLTHHRPLSTPDVSPNGNRIVSWLARGDGGIEVMRDDGTHHRELATSGFDPVFSPNGKKIAFEGSETKRGSRIVLMRADGSHRRALAMPPRRFNGFPDWGPRSSSSTRTSVLYVPNGDGVLHAYQEGTWTEIGSWQMPFRGPIRGSDADPSGGFLYIAYGGDGGTNGTGSLLKWNLVTESAEWNRSYSFGVDQFAYCGGRIYMPTGEAASGSKVWEILDADTGDVVGSLTAGTKPHNTICHNGNVYMGPRSAQYLFTASTTGTQITARKIGPTPSAYNGVRPFTVNAADTRSWIAWSKFRGFSIANSQIGQILATVNLVRCRRPSRGALQVMGSHLLPTAARSTCSIHPCSRCRFTPGAISRSRWRRSRSAIRLRARRSPVSSTVRRRAGCCIRVMGATSSWGSRVM